MSEYYTTAWDEVIVYSAERAPFTELVALPCVVTETGNIERNKWCMKENI
jgi:hypothetical protein